MSVVKPRIQLRVIKPFQNYPRGFILTEVGALYREYLLERGWVEVVKPEPKAAEPVLAGGLDPIMPAEPGPQPQQQFNKRSKK